MFSSYFPKRDAPVPEGISEHAAFLENEDDENDRDDEEQGHCGPHYPRMGLQCVTEDVHSEKAGNEGRRHKQQGHQGEDFHYLVLGLNFFVRPRPCFAIIFTMQRYK